jgi:hypothetical protein
VKEAINNFPLDLLSSLWHENLGVLLIAETETLISD